jgi:PAS domain S-box-containing protein
MRDRATRKVVPAAGVGKSAFLPAVYAAYCAVAACVVVFSAGLVDAADASTIPTAELVHAVAMVMVPLLLVIVSGGFWLLRREIARKTEDIRQAQQRFKNFMDSATDGFLLYDEQLRLVEINDRALELLPFKASKARLLGSSLDNGEMTSVSVLARAVRLVLSSGDPCSQEEDLSNPGRGPFHLVMTCFAVPDGVGVILRDITERKLGVERMRRHEEDIRLLLDNTVEGIYGCDLEGRCTFANPACVKMLGYERVDRLIGVNMHQLIHHSHADGRPYPQEACPLERVARSRESVHRDSEVFWNAAGTPFPVEYWSHPIHRGEEVRGWVVTFVDISKRLQAEAEKRQLESKLHQSFKMEAIGTLAGGIAHDFNNILGAIIGYTEMALEDAGHESASGRHMREVLKAGRRAKNLVRRILDFSRQNTGSEFQYLRPGSIIMEVEKMLRPSLPASIDIRLDMKRSDLCVHADPTQIHQILMNLCTNAFHAMEESGGTLGVSLCVTELSASDVAHQPELLPGRFFRITVSDTGPGIPPELRNKIFDPFFTTKEIGKGTGMGLAMVHGIVRNHGGFVSLDDRPEGGAVFHVFLPAVEQQGAEEGQQEALPTGREHILLVDDEDMLLEMGREVLGRLGYSVTVARGSRQALEEFRRDPGRFDLVVTDQTMPEMNGSELSRQILQLCPSMPIIVCTGYSSVLSEEKSREIGIRALVYKPVLKGEFARIVRTVLDGGHPEYMERVQEDARDTAH